MKILTILGLICIGMGLFYGDCFASAQLDSGNFTIHYQEPLLDSDGSPLEDLKETRVYYTINGGAKVLKDTVLAVSMNGGAVIQKVYTIDNLPATANVVWIYTAADFSGNESLEFVEPNIRIDNVPPSSPTDVQ